MNAGVVRKLMLVCFALTLTSLTLKTGVAVYWDQTVRIEGPTDGLLEWGVNGPEHSKTWLDISWGQIRPGYVDVYNDELGEEHDGNSYVHMKGTAVHELRWDDSACCGMPLDRVWVWEPCLTQGLGGILAYCGAQTSDNPPPGTVWVQLSVNPPPGVSGVVTPPGEFEDGTQLTKWLAIPSDIYWIEIDPDTGQCTRQASFEATSEPQGTRTSAGMRFISACDMASSYQELATEWAAMVYSPIRPRTDVAHGGGLTGGEPVDLVWGQELYLPAPDLAAYNPTGPSVLYRRNYSSGRAKTGYGSPGLSAGWVDNFDVTIKEIDDEWGTGWKNLKLIYPTGGSEILVPTTDLNGQPTGEICAPAGVPYMASGIPVDAQDPTKGWAKIRITWKDGTTWSLTPYSPSNYAKGRYILTEISNRLAQSVTISRGYEGRVSSVGGDLLTFSYDTGDRLASIQDKYGRKVTYTFDDDELYLDGNGVQHRRVGNLRKVSQIGSLSDPTIPDHWRYGYQKVKFYVGQLNGVDIYYDKYHLTSISFPSPEDNGSYTTQSVEYYEPPSDKEVCGRVKLVRDGNGNTHNYEYEPSAGTTTVRVKNALDILASETVYTWYVSRAWNQTVAGCTKIEEVKDASTKYATTLTYDDPGNPALPTCITDPTGKSVSYSYDSHGSVLTSADPRSVTAIYGYDYTTFPLGWLNSVKVSAGGTEKQVAEMGYFNNGLIEWIRVPKPGSDTGSEKVQTNFGYNPLGDVETIDMPRPGADGARMTITYDYGASPKIGQPLTVKVNGVTKAQFTYDDLGRGNLKTVTDPLGNMTEFEYNIADQIWKVWYPAVETP